MASTQLFPIIETRYSRHNLIAPMIKKAHLLSPYQTFTSFTSQYKGLAQVSSSFIYFTVPLARRLMNCQGQATGEGDKFKKKDIIL